MSLNNVLAVAVADGTALSNSVSETVLGSIALPAGSLQAGKVYRFSALVHTTSSNSTDTLTIYVRLGNTTLTGTALFTSSAVDQVNDDRCVIEGTLVVRDADSASNVIAYGLATPPDAIGTAVVSFVATKTDYNAAAAGVLEVTGKWSVAHASNSCKLVSLILEEKGV